MQIDLMHKCLDAANEVMILLRVPDEELVIADDEEVVVKTISVVEVLAAVSKHVPHEFTDYETRQLGRAISIVLNVQQDDTCKLWELAHGFQHFFSDAAEAAERN